VLSLAFEQHVKEWIFLSSKYLLAQFVEEKKVFLLLYLAQAWVGVFVLLNKNNLPRFTQVKQKA